MYRTAPVAALLCLALGLASCGGGGSRPAGTSALPSTDGTATSPTSGGAVADRGNGGASSAAAGPPADDACIDRLGNFVDRMNDLRHALLAGLSYSEYVVRVRAVRDAYDSVAVDRLGGACLAGAADRAEDAFNQYLRAANTWGDCAATAGCAASEIEGRLQHRWHLASKSLDAAEREG